MFSRIFLSTIVCALISPLWLAGTSRAEEVCSASSCGHSDCDSGCKLGHGHGKGKGVCPNCQVVPTIKRSTKVVYSYETVYYCKHKFGGFGHQGCGCKGGCNKGCGSKNCCDSCVRCGEVRCRRVLLKKFVPVEEHVCECQPIYKGKKAYDDYDSRAPGEAPSVEPQEPPPITYYEKAQDSNVQTVRPVSTAYDDLFPGVSTGN